MSGLSFTLLFRLPDGHRPQGSEWIDWQFGERIVPQSVYGDPHDEPPYKRYPSSHHYFAPQVEQTLFPRPKDPAEESGRWIRRPVSWWVAVGPGSTPTHELAVDLLEIVRVELEPHIAYGVAHLNLVGHSSMDDMLGSARVLMTRYRATDADLPSFELRTGSGAQPLLGNAPLAEIPEDMREEDFAPWRRALGQGESLDDARATLEERPEHDEHRMVRLGPTLATFYGRTAVYTYRTNRSAALRNVRSYRAETVLFALMQHAHIETYAIELGRLGGEPLGPAIDKLFVRWLAFRNILWWQHPSFTTPEPRRILRDARHELKTEPLYENLATAFTTYVEARRHRAEETESRALRALQVYGAAFAVVSTIAAVMQVLGESYVDTRKEQIGYALMLAGVALAVIFGVTLWVRHREKNA